MKKVLWCNSNEKCNWRSFERENFLIRWDKESEGDILSEFSVNGIYCGMNWIHFGYFLTFLGTLTLSVRAPKVANGNLLLVILIWASPDKESEGDIHSLSFQSMELLWDELNTFLLFVFWPGASSDEVMVNFVMAIQRKTKSFKV